MEKHGFTVKHQAELLEEYISKLEHEVNMMRGRACNILDKVSNNPTPDYGRLPLPSGADMLAMANRVTATATRLETLIMLAAIENKQVDG